MLTPILISIVFLTAAVVWSVILWRSLGNWRVLILTALFAIILIRRIQVLAHSLGWGDPMPPSGVEWVTVLIAALALCTVIAWHVYIAGRGRAQRQLEFLASALSASADAVLIVDARPLPDGFRIYFVNDSFCRMTGYTREELVGKSTAIFSGPSTDKEVLADSVAEVTAGRPSVIEVISSAKGGREYWVELSVAPIRDPRGRTTHYFINQRDITDRKRVDTQLRLADLRYRSITRATGTGFAEVDPHGIIIDANEEFIRLTGRKHPSEVIGHSVLEWTAPHDLERNAVEVAKCAATGHVRGLEIDYIAPDSTIIPVEISAVTIEELGAPRIISFCRDISDRRRADADLRASEERYRRIVETAHEGLWIVDANWKTTFANRRMGEILGWKAEDMIGHHLFDFMDEEGRRITTQNMDRREHGIRETHDFRFVRPDGSSVWTAISTNAILDHAGRFAGALAMVSDITERKLADERIRANEVRLASMVRHTPLAVILWDKDFRIAEWNPAAEAIFGWTAAEIIGEHAHVLVPESVHPYVDEIWRGLSTNKGGTRGTNENVTKDKRIISCEWYNSPLVGPDGRVIGVVSLCQDVTERVRAEQRQHTLMLELDHRVKNNLAAILALAEQTLYTSDSLQQFGDAFTGRLRAMSRMHELLAHSRWQHIDLRDMVHRSLEAYVIGHKPPITLTGEPLPLPSKIATGLSLVLHELATNAAKYGSLSAPTGQVHVEWSVPDASPESQSNLVINWSESGGPAVTAPQRRGFGTGLIEGIVAYEFGGSVHFDFNPSGLCCRIVIPFVRLGDTAETPSTEHSASS